MKSPPPAQRTRGGRGEAPRPRGKAHPARDLRRHRRAEQTQIERKRIGIREAGEEAGPECRSDRCRLAFKAGEQVLAPESSAQRSNPQPGEIQRRHDPERARQHRCAREQQMRPAEGECQPAEIPQRDAEDGEQGRPASVGERKAGDNKCIGAGTHHRGQIDQVDRPEQPELSAHACRPPVSRSQASTIGQGERVFHRPRPKSGTSCGLPRAATERMLSSTRLEIAAASYTSASVGSPRRRHSISR